MIVEAHSKRRGKRKNNSSVVKPANNKAAPTRESKKSANQTATSIGFLIYFSKKLLRNALCKFITENVRNISNVCTFRLLGLLISNIYSIALINACLNVAQLNYNCSAATYVMAYNTQAS